MSSPVFPLSPLHLTSSTSLPIFSFIPPSSLCPSLPVSPSHLSIIFPSPCSHPLSLSPPFHPPFLSGCLLNERMNKNDLQPRLYCDRNNLLRLISLFLSLLSFVFISLLLYSIFIFSLHACEEGTHCRHFIKTCL